MTTAKVALRFNASDICAVMATVAENPYLRDAVMTATPEQLQLMLYDGAIRMALQARDAIERRDFETSFNKLSRAQSIVLEMQNGLNYEINRPLCERVAAIYNFIYRKLIDANVGRNVADIDDALKVLRVERETWQILVDKVNHLRPGDTTASNLSSSPDEQPASGFTIEG
jgi:flagellar protein FliS